MDEKQINAAGAKPLDAEFARIDGIKSTAEIQAEIARLQGMGVGALFEFGSTQDEKNSSQVIGANAGHSSYSYELHSQWSAVCRAYSSPRQL